MTLRGADPSSVALFGPAELYKTKKFVPQLRLALYLSGS